jgi:hypothetical protein
MKNRVAGAQIDFGTVRSIALSLPDVDESTIYGSPALKVRGKLLTFIPIHRSVERDSLGVCIDTEKRSVLIAAVPDIYYVTDHYRKHPTVLVRLSRIGLAELRNLLKVAWQFVNSQTGDRARPARKRSPSRTRR